MRTLTRYWIRRKNQITTYSVNQLAQRTPKVTPLGLSLDLAGPEKLHAQIGAQLRRAILERRLPPGSALPSSRLLAKELACARGTVLLALEQLTAEGYVVARRGSGVTVARDLPDDGLIARPASRRAGPNSARTSLSKRGAALLAGSLDAPKPWAQPSALRVGAPDLDAFPFKLWSKLLEADWRRPADTQTRSPHPFGHERLRSAIAAYLGAARGFASSPAEIVVTSGIRESVDLLATLLLDPGDAVWMEEPGYSGTRAALRMAGAEVAAIPVDEHGFSPAAAERMAAKARLAVVAPAHHYPLGTVLSLSRRLALLDWAQRQGSWILEDDFDGEYRYAGRPFAPLRALDGSGRVAYAGSFSKLLFPSLRLSYLVLPTALVQPAERQMSRHPAAAAILGQGALARFIADGHFAAHLRRTRSLYAARQDALLAALRLHLGQWLVALPDEGGMHLVARPLPQFQPSFDDEAVATAAAEWGVAVTPLSPCYDAQPGTPGLLLGYAGTLLHEIEPAVSRLQGALSGMLQRGVRC